ncbi:MAG TPA: NAD(P)-binding protein [Pseudonocardia sp.]|nr:NAD(P)-binding protein [Pseudonocardia sp.]
MTRPVDQPAHSSYDALVVGAGAGGMAAAARLNHYGYRTLLVESRDRVGGRASTMEVDGFTVNTGALVLELGGANGRLFAELGVDPGAPVLARPPMLRVGRRDLSLTSGPVGAAVRHTTAGLGAVARRFPRLRPSAAVHTAAWLDSLRAGPGTHRLVRNLTSALFAAEPADVPAALFFDYLTKPGALRDYGAHPDGSVGPWRVLAEHYERTGGVLWCDSSVTGLTVDGSGLVDGAWVRRGGELVRVATRLAVSNAGPLATVELCRAGGLPAEYSAQVRAWSRPSTLITVNFATRWPVRRLDSLVFFGSTRRLAYAANLTALSPRMARPGWHLYAAASTPSPATGEFDEATEVALLEADLLAQFPEYGTARVLSVEICAGQRWPAQRAIAGHDLPDTTPLPNLWNVGDGVRPWTGAGQSGCVESAMLVTDQVRARYPAAALRSPAYG